MTSETKETGFILTRENRTVWMEFMREELEDKQCFYVLAGLTAAQQKSKAKLHLVMLSRNAAVNDPSADVITQRIYNDNTKCRRMIKGKVDSDVRGELHGKTAKQIWDFCSTFGINDKVSVVTKMRQEIEDLRPDQFKNPLAFTIHARKKWVEFKNNYGPLEFTEKDFISRVIRTLPAMFEKTSEKFFDKQDNGIEVIWEDVIKDIQAKQANSRSEDEPARTMGGHKSGNHEEKDTALHAEIKSLRATNVSLMTANKVITKANKNVALNSKPGNKEAKDCYTYRDYGKCRFGKECRFKHGGRDPTDGDIPKGYTKPDRKFSRRRRDSDDEEEEAHVAQSKRRKDKGRRTRVRTDQFGLHLDEQTNVITSMPSPRNVFRSFFTTLLLVVFVMWVFTLIGSLVGTRSNVATVVPMVNYTIDVNVSTVAVATATALVVTGYNYNFDPNVWTDCVLAAFDNTSPNKAVSDSGATCHTIGCKKLFSKMTNIRVSNETIWMNNFRSNITHRGDLQISLRVDTANDSVKYQKVTLYNVAYVPTSNHNLFSITSYLDGCYKFFGVEANVTYTHEKSTITLPQGGTYTGTRVDNLYLIKWPEEEEEEVMNLHKQTNLKTKKREKKARHRANKKVFGATQDPLSTSEASNADSDDAELPRLVESSESSCSDSDSDGNSSQTSPRKRGRRGRKNASH